MCRVISVTTPRSGPRAPSGASGISSASATSETCSRNSSSAPAGPTSSGSTPGWQLAAGLLQLGDPALVVLLGDGDELGEVLDAGLVLRVVAGAQLGEVAALLEHHLEQRGDAVVGLVGGAQPLEQGGEALDRGDRPGRDAGGVLGPAEGGDEGDALALGESGHAGLGPVADAALGGVEDAAQVDGVGRVGDDAQVGERVLDLAPLVEARAADDLVGQADPHEHLLDGTALRVGAVEHGDVARLDAVLGEGVDLLGDEGRLVVLVVADVAGDHRAVAGVGPEVLGPAALVAGDDGVGGPQDALGRAVVLLEQDGAGVGVVLLELEDVADARAPEGVDRLVGVADDAQLGRRHGVGRPRDP